MFLQKYYDGKTLLVDKPLDWTSFDVVNKLKLSLNKLRTKQEPRVKVGHAGTLDPRATGLLIIGTGKHTKKLEEIQGLPKTYTGTLKLGTTTASLDSEEPEEGKYPIDHITAEAIEETRKSFLGEQEQIPPMFSAIMVDGVRLYEHARKGKTLELKPRKIVITDFEILGIEMPFVHFKVSCSKGTYIRSIAGDFGKALGSAAYLTELRRTAIGEYLVLNAQSPEEAASLIQNELRALEENKS